MLQNLKKGAIVCLKITLIFGLIFSLLFNQISVFGITASLCISAMYSFGLGFGNMLINIILSNKWSWITENKQRVWAGIITTVLYTIPVVLLINYVLFIIIYNNDASVFFSGEFLWIHLFYIILSLGISAFLHAKSFMEAWKKSVTQETTKQEFVAKTETAKFETLKSQIDPHFLFNSLNVLTSLIGENPAQAEKFTTKLSKVYRYVLEQRNKDLVPLSEELQFAKSYMQLLQMRFEDAVEFTISVSEEIAQQKIVPLSLQLLLENAVKHNVVSSSKPLKVEIFSANGFLKISNNINPKDSIGKKSTKIGLQNIADRYGLITNKQVEITNNKKTFTVSLPLLTQINSIMKTSEDFENNSYVRAVERVQKMKEFYQNIITYLIMVPVFIFINLRFVPQFHWFWFPMIGWGIGVIFHGLEVYNYSFFLGKNWEEKKIKEMMDDNQKL